MKIRFVFGFLPAFIFYTNFSIPKKKFMAITRYMFVFIRPRFRNNRCIVEHELQHVRQVYRTFFLWPFIYFLSKKKRLEYEAEAYAKQVICKGGHDRFIRAYARLIAALYDLDVSPAQAYTAIKRCLLNDKDYLRCF